MKRSRRRNPETLWRLAALVVPIAGSAAIAYAFRPKDAQGKGISVPPSRVLAGQGAAALLDSLPLPPLSFVGYQAAPCPLPSDTVWKDVKGSFFLFDGVKLTPIDPADVFVTPTPAPCYETLGG